MEFCTLGVHNDTRGKDSVGIYIDGQTEYYCKGKNNSLFSEFISKSRLLQSVEVAQVAYGHDRAASIGTVSIETAQPVVLKEDDKITYMLMHNGTIYNYEDLAKKYIPDVDIKGMTDSQVMARIFYKAGYDALNEYIGGAVFAIIDYRGEKPKYLFWQGHSKSTQYSQTSQQEERPLFFLKSKGEMMFSSLDTYLDAFRRQSTKLVPTPNLLIEYDPETEEFISLGEYDRKNCFQTKPYTATTTTYYGNNNYGSSTGNYSHSTNRGTSCYSSGYVNTDTHTGQCRKGASLLHGSYSISTYGNISESANQNGSNYMTMWFFNGILMKNEQAFIYLSKFCKECGLSIDECFKWYDDLVYYLSPYPYREKKIAGIPFMFKTNDPAGSEEYTGDVLYPFSTYSKRYVNGSYVSTRTSTFVESLEAYNKTKDDKLDIDVLMKV